MVTKLIMFSAIDEDLIKNVEGAFTIEKLLGHKILYTVWRIFYVRILILRFATLVTLNFI